MKNIFFVIELVCIMLFISCASKPRFEGNGDLCGLIIDENNKPVKDFIVTCRAKGLNAQLIKPVITNESGLFVFYDLSSGSYSISGEKKNYMKIYESDYNFNDRTKILCLQTKSFKGAIKNAEELIRLEEKKEAENILNSIECNRKSDEALIIQFYKFFTSDSDKEKKSIAKKLQKASAKNQECFKDYAQKLLEVVK